MAADKRLRTGIGKLDKTQASSSEAQDAAAHSWLDRTAPASAVRKEFASLCTAYVVAHAGLAVYPEIHRRIGAMDLDRDPAHVPTKSDRKKVGTTACA